MLPLLRLLPMSLRRFLLPAAVIHALQQQALWLRELELLRRGLECQKQSRRHGGLRSAQADLLLTIGDELETLHGWTPLQVDLWLDRLGLWDQEL
jgi:hypothetical protein